jgi:hypothetical protein
MVKRKCRLSEGHKQRTGGSLMILPKIRDTFSPSFLKKFSNCQRSAVFDTFTPNDSTEFGNEVHKLFARIFDPKNPLSKEFFLRNIEFELTKGSLRKLDYQKFIKKAQMIEAYLKSGKFDPPEGMYVWDIESQTAFPEEFQENIKGKRFFNIPLFENGKRLRGQIDVVYMSKPELVKHKTLIRDWKTGTSENDSYQIILYMLAVIRALWLDTDKVELAGEYAYVETGEIVPVYFEEEEILRTMDEMERLLRDYYNAYKMNFFNTNPSWDNCRFCTVKDCNQKKGK